MTAKLKAKPCPAALPPLFNPGSYCGAVEKNLGFLPVRKWGCAGPLHYRAASLLQLVCVCAGDFRSELVIT